MAKLTLKQREANARSIEKKRLRHRKTIASGNTPLVTYVKPEIVLEEMSDAQKPVALFFSEATKHEPKVNPVVKQRVVLQKTRRSV